MGLADKYLKSAKENDLPLLLTWEADGSCKIELWTEKDAGTKTFLKLVDHDDVDLILRNGSTDMILSRSKIRFVRLPIIK